MATDVVPADAEVAGPSIWSVAVDAWALLLSVGLLMAGAGLQGSLLGVRAGGAGFNATVTGVVLGSYYLGVVAGSSVVPAMIRNVGHIRAFAGLASMVSATAVIHGVWISPLPWLVMRFVAGMCLSGLFVVAESWLADVSTPANRGTLLSLYMIMVTGGLIVGQFLLNVADIEGFVLFVVASTLLSLSVVPMAFAPQNAPAPRDPRPFSLLRLYRQTPLALFGSMASGFGSGVGLGYGAVYAISAGFGIAGASQVVAAVLAGAVAGMYPLGWVSDRVDRRLVIAGAAVLAAASAIVVVQGTSAATLAVVIVGAFGVGAGAFPLYSLSLAHLGDYLDPEDVVAAGARMIMANGVGAAAGPLTAAVLVESRGPGGMFEAVIVVFGTLAAYALYRPFRRKDTPEEHKAHFTPVAATATSAGLDIEVPELIGEELSADDR